MAERKDIIKQCSLNSMALISSVKYASISKNLSFIFACLFAPATRCVWIFLSIIGDSVRQQSVFFQESSNQVSKWMKYLLQRTFSSLFRHRSLHLYSKIKRRNSCFPYESQIILFCSESQEVFVHCRQTIQSKNFHFRWWFKYGKHF